MTNSKKQSVSIFSHFSLRLSHHLKCSAQHILIRFLGAGKILIQSNNERCCHLLMKIFPSIVVLFVNICAFSHWNFFLDGIDKETSVGSFKQDCKKSSFKTLRFFMQILFKISSQTRFVYGFITLTYIYMPELRSNSVFYDYAICINIFFIHLR